MNELRAWVLCIIAAAAASTFAMAVSPRGAMDKTIRAVAGIFVVAAICTPLAGLLKSDFSLPAFAWINEDSDCGSEEELREYITETCKNAAEREIEETAGQLGIEIEQVTVDMNIDDDNCIIIHNISVKTKDYSSADPLGFAALLSERLGLQVTLDSE